jgi:RNA polymerase sigma factor FliA
MNERIPRIWFDFVRTRDKGLRDQLIVRYTPLVSSIARRLGAGLPSHIDIADLISFGLIGLIEAIDRFDPLKGAKFETYGTIRIRGAIIDELRKQDWAPRAIRERAREIETAKSQLHVKLGRIPTQAEVAEVLEVPVEELAHDLKEISRSSIAFLDQTWSNDEGDEGSLLDTVENKASDSPTEAFDEVRIRAALVEGIDLLNNREKLVAAMIYYEEMPLREVADLLEVSQGRVSQIHSQLLEKLKARLSVEEGLEDSE